MSAENPQIVMYSTTWCADCNRSKEVLRQEGTAFTEIDIEKVEGALEKMKSLNGGRNSVPTIQLPDGTILVEPDNTTLRETLLKLKAPTS